MSLVPAPTQRTPPADPASLIVHSAQFTTRDLRSTRHTGSPWTRPDFVPWRVCLCVMNAPCCYTSGIASTDAPLQAVAFFSTETVCLYLLERGI